MSSLLSAFEVSILWRAQRPVARTAGRRLRQAQGQRPEWDRDEAGGEGGRLIPSPRPPIPPPPFTLPANPARPAHCPSPLRRAHPSPRTTATRHPTIDRRGCPLPLRSVLAEVLPVATELLLYSPECADNAADVLRSVCDAIPYHEDTAALQQAFLP